MKKIKDNKGLKILFEVWIAGLCYFLFTIVLPLHSVGIIIVLTLVDTLFFEKKGFIKNLIFNILIYFSYDLICLALHNSYDLNIADALTFMVYYFVVNCVVFEEVLKMREEKTIERKEKNE